MKKQIFAALLTLASFQAFASYQHDIFSCSAIEAAYNTERTNITLDVIVDQDKDGSEQLIQMSKFSIPGVRVQKSILEETFDYSLVQRFNPFGNEYSTFIGNAGNELTLILSPRISKNTKRGFLAEIAILNKKSLKKRITYSARCEKTTNSYQSTKYGF